MHEFKLPDMSCGHCAGRITQALRQLDPACRVEIKLPAHSVQVHSSLERQALAKALAEAGYPPA